MSVLDPVMNSTWHEPTLAAIHLWAVVPALEPLLANDPAAREVAGPSPWALRLRIAGGPSATVRWDGKRMQVNSEDLAPVDAVLTFLTPSHLNGMFLRTPGAIPPFTLRGLFRLEMTRRFQAVMDRLESVLKPGSPAEDTLRAPAMLRLAAGGLRALSAYDQEVRSEMARMPRGLAEFVVEGINCAAWIDNSTDPWTVGTGRSKASPDVRITFRDSEIAIAAFDNRLDPNAALGLCQVRVDGCLPLAEALNHTLERMQGYLLPSQSHAIPQPI